MRNLKYAVALCALLSFSGAQAAALTVNGGWSTFSFGTTGSSWSDSFTFTLTTTGVLSVTDYQWLGDEFEFTDGTTTWVTQTATDVSSYQQYDIDLAFADPLFSSISVFLNPGTYTITGIVSDSPWDGGSGAIRVEANAVPLPAAVWLFGSALVGFIGFGRRKTA
jgi:hypothetical protein